MARGVGRYVLFQNFLIGGVMKRCAGVAGALSLCFCFASSSFALNAFSWEDGTLQEWLSESLNQDPVFGALSNATVVTSAPGVPTDWIDGTHFVELTNQKFGADSILFRGPGAVQPGGAGTPFENVLFTELRQNTTIDADFWIPTASIQGFSTIRFWIEVEGSHGKENFRLPVTSQASQAGVEGAHYHVTWNYAQQFMTNKSVDVADFGWGQVNIRVQAFFTSDPLDREDSLSPFYMDNFRFSGASAPGMPGDFNNDGKVDAADYTVWRNNFGVAEDDTVLGGNGDNMGNVDLDDYNLWKAHFGTGTEGAGSAGLRGAAVPEPGGLALGLSLLGAGLFARRRKI